MYKNDFIGIGIFVFLTIFELSNLLEYLLGQLLFLTKPGLLAILWLPEVFGMAIYIALLLWGINKVSKSTFLFSRKILIRSVVIFFVLILVKFLYSMYGTGLLYEAYPEEFEAFHVLRDENAGLQSMMAFVPTLKYLVAALLFLFNKKAIANNDVS